MTRIAKTLALSACLILWSCSSETKDKKPATTPPAPTQAKAAPQGAGSPPPPPQTAKKVATAGTHPPELVGAWRASGTAGGDKPGQRGMSWFKEYHFAADGTFTMNGYPPIQVKGNWLVSKRDKARLRIVLSQQEMRMGPNDPPSKWKDREDWADLQGDAMSWQNNKFSRVKPK